MPSLPPRWRDSALQFVCALILQSSPQTQKLDLRSCYFEATSRSLSLQPGDSQPSFDGFVGRLQSLGFPPPCYPSYGAPTLTPVGLSPTECASLSWTHRPAQRSLTLRPTCSPSHLCDPLHRRLRRLCYLHRRSDCYRVERTSSRAGLSPAVDQRFSRRTTQ